MKIAEKDKNALEGPKNEAIAYLTAENEITVKKNCVFQTYKWVTCLFVYCVLFVFCAVSSDIHVWAV